MKKIFAIALALVMVLSMASAFASYCTAGFDWTCATDDTFCGQGAVEVVPYVKVNNSCEGYDWQVSECASAVNSENVYYALKLTVDEYADAEWWAAAGIKLTYKGMKKAAPAVKLNWNKLAGDKDFEKDEVNVFYYDFKAEAWDIVNDDFELADTNVRAEKVEKAADAKVCAELTSKKEVKKGALEGIVGDYYVMYTEAAGAVEAADAWVTATVKTSAYDKIAAHKDWTILAVVYDGANSVVTAVPKAETPVKDKAYFTANPANSIVTFTKGTTAVTKGVTYDYEEQVEAVAGTETQLVVLDKKGGKPLVTYTIVDGKVRTIKNTPVCGEAEYATIKAFFGLEIGTCVDADLIAANFGWDFEQKDCYEWSDKAASIVDAECVVAIPKTGDASVLAWLF